MPTILVTGANRGLGLEFVRQYSAEGWHVHACCRAPNEANALTALAERSGNRVALHRLDVSNPAQIGELAAELDSAEIDVLLNNAGILAAVGANWEKADFGDIDYSAWEKAFSINAIAPMRVAEAFVEQVARSEQKLMVFLSTQLGSITNADTGLYQYRSSKAALNMVVKLLSHDLKPRGISTLAVHPGWVSTDMGGESAPVTPPESVSGLRNVIGAFRPEQSGEFYQYDGTALPW